MNTQKGITFKDSVMVCKLILKLAYNFIASVYRTFQIGRNILKQEGKKFSIRNVFDALSVDLNPTKLDGSEYSKEEFKEEFDKNNFIGFLKNVKSFEIDEIKFERPKINNFSFLNKHGRRLRHLTIERSEITDISFLKNLAQLKTLRGCFKT